MNYYDRNEHTYIDGTPIFKTPQDEKNEDEISKVIEKSWGYECKSFGKLAPVDWYFVKNGRLTGIGELKSRTHESSTYPTVFLNVRKWLALTLASCGLKVPALFVVRFTDTVLWINVANIDASKVRIGGCSKIVKSRNDVEPVIEVPIHKMFFIERSKSGQGELY